MGRQAKETGALIDASVLIAVERDELDLATFLDRHRASNLYLAAITASELLHGVHRLRASKRKIRAEAFVAAILERVPVVPFDRVCARIHARLGAELMRDGRVVGAHDLQIAATAVARGLSVVTRDRRGFSRIPDLVVDVL